MVDSPVYVPQKGRLNILLVQMNAPSVCNVSACICVPKFCEGAANDLARLRRVCVSVHLIHVHVCIITSNNKEFAVWHVEVVFFIMFCHRLGS